MKHTLAAEEKAVLFVVGAIQCLKDNGMLGGNGASHEASPSGTSAFDQLEASGYRPSQEEVLHVMVAMRMKFSSDRDAQAFVTLITNWDQVKAKA